MLCRDSIAAWPLAGNRGQQPDKQAPCGPELQREKKKIKITLKFCCLTGKFAPEKEMMERKERSARSPAFRGIYQATEQVCLLLLLEITDKRTYGRTTIGRT